jgi:hypothetical protein
MSTFVKDFKRAFPVLSTKKPSASKILVATKATTSLSDIISILGSAGTALQTVINLIASIDWDSISTASEALWADVVKAYNALVAYFTGDDTTSTDSVSVRLANLKEATKAFKKSL